ncbi:uncharacterized protein LOC128995290 isoform X2 [Macrosteles quadrilineatus]|uniref:uncharacterized protein LOC128995290 isoform X2 n=1 Tax=Macrosteles quadrilineatus TaxID=74068 RepID=UPI0023E117AF|nr:uncharacterized protein LOC128995290 isoform X2 [Macrosteles quadrilineatus]
MAEATNVADGDKAVASATDKENKEPSKTEDMETDDNLDLKEIFGKKKRKKKKGKEAFNLEALPDAMDKTKQDTIDRGENKEAIEDNISHDSPIDFSTLKKKKKKKKMNIEEFVAKRLALEEKKEIDQGDKDHGKLLNQQPPKMVKDKKSLIFNSENENREKTIIINQIAFQYALKPPPWLERMESPLKWVTILERKLTYYLMHQKLHDYKNQGAFYGFEKFAILLVIISKRALMHLCFNENSQERTESDESKDQNTKDENESGEDEDFEGDEEDQLMKYYYELDEALAKCDETVEEMAAAKDVMYLRIGPVFHHVLQTTKAHILFLQQKVTESRELARKIQNVDEMSQECKAGIYGLRVKFIMSMYQDYTVLIPLLSRAIELDPGFGYWYYLSGKVIRRLRREFNENMVIEELDHFAKAVELERNPKFLVFLAQAYQELANLLFYSKDPSVTNAVDEFLQESSELFRECWQLKNDSASISKRVGNGMMKMKRGFFDKKVAIEALLKANELSFQKPNLALGKFYCIHEQNIEKALEYFEKDAPSSFASSEIIRLNLIKNPNYDSEEILIEWVNADQGTLKQQSALCDYGWYYLMYRNDLESAVKHFWTVLQGDYKAYKVLEFQSYGFMVQGPINMVKVLVNEILLTKEQNENLPPEKRQNIEELDRFLDRMLEKYPDLKDITPNPKLLDQLRKKVENSIDFHRRRFFGVNRSYGVNPRRNELKVRSDERRNWRGKTNPEDSKAQELEEQKPNWQKEEQRNLILYLTDTKDNRRDWKNTFDNGDNDRKSREFNCNRSSERDGFNWRTRDPREEMGQQSRVNTTTTSYNNNRGRSNSRYDVTVTDWRREGKN